MKKLIIILIAFILHNFSSNAQQNNPYFYYYNGEKFYLELDSSSLLIISEERLSNESIKDKIGTLFSEIGHSAEKNTKQNVVLTDKTSKPENDEKEFICEVYFSKEITKNKYFEVTQILQKDIDVLQTTPIFLVNNKKLGVSNNFYVKLHHTDDMQILSEMADKYSLEILGYNEYMPLWYTLSCTKQTSISTIEAANLFFESNLFASAEPEFLYYDLSTSNDQYFPNQWGLKNTGQHCNTSNIDIRAEDAWTNTTGSPNIRVAIFDNGIKTDHPDLINNIYGIGYDAQTNTTPAIIRGSHGTPCAGIVSAEQNNSIGISGVSPNSKLIPISINLTWGDTPQQLANGFNWAWQNGADIISNSWGGYAPSYILEDAIINTLNQGRNGKGTIVVFASGNENNTDIRYPGISLPDIIVVGAISPKGERKSYTSCDGEGWGSCYGSQLDIMAPGVFIPTTTYTGGYTQTFNGTSSACPHVAGVAALMLSVNPDLTRWQVEGIIKSTAQQVGGYNYQNTPSRPGWNNEMGYGLVNAHAAVLAAKCYDGSGTIAPLSIANNSTCSANMYIAGTLTIESGATLTVTSTIKCAPNAKIIVKPNAKLIVDGGILTSSCDGELWQGIEVWGTQSQISQVNLYHGEVELKNNALIENAVCGIYVGCPSLTDQQNGYGGGGFITADRSTFKNNKKSIEFRPYTRKNSYGIEMLNATLITDCNFITDNNAFFSVKASDAMVRLYGVRDVRFNECTFQDNQKKTGLSDYGIAIYANRASISMSATGFRRWIDPPFVPKRMNTFSGFGRAIVLKDAGTKASKINWTHFTNNNVAIYASLVNKLSVISCAINVNPDFLINGRHGIYMEYCDGYIIENNIFLGDGTGLRIKESGEGNNTIRYNTFQEMCLTSLASGKNGAMSSDINSCTGLQFKCNKYISNDEDIRVDQGQTSLIRLMQGTPQIGAGNIFNNASMALRNASPNLFIYSYNQTQANHFPTGYPTYSYGPIGLIPLSTHSCSSIGFMGLDYYYLHVLEIAELDVAYLERMELFQEKRTSYISIYEGKEINWEELIKSGADLMKIPQVALYTEITELAEEMHLICNDVFARLIDADEFDRQTYNTWLERENKLRSYYLWAESNVESNDWKQVEQILKDLPLRFPSYDKQELDNYYFCLDLQNKIHNNYPYVITDQEIANLEALTLEFREIPSAKLRAILEYLERGLYCINLDNKCGTINGRRSNTTDLLPNEQKSASNITDNLQAVDEKQYSLSIYPNPFNDVLQLRLDNSSDLSIERVQIYSISGQVLCSIDNIGSIRTAINLSNLPVGIYFMHVSLNNGEIKIKRIIKE